MATQPTQPKDPDERKAKDVDEPKPAEDTPSSHETSGQFPADEVAATFEKAEPKRSEQKS